MKKDFVQCVFCTKIVPTGIRRFKQHLDGGYVNTEKCPKAPELVREEMHAYLKKNTRTVLKNTRTVFVQVTKDGEQEQDANEESEGEQVVEAKPLRVPSSGTKVKQEIMKIT
jgi:2,4-dienoyl-CoA reductase-like NADH-dependent reductase (Old Yellow Enzyme family)